MGCKTIIFPYLKGKYLASKELQGLLILIIKTSSTIIRNYYSKIIENYFSTLADDFLCGIFCIAHPDLIRFTGDAKVRDYWYRRLCRDAIEADVPLEINMLGVGQDRSYPNAGFWTVAAASGCRVVLGVDAHRPGSLCDPALREKTLAFAHSFGIEPEERPALPRGGLLL